MEVGKKAGSSTQYWIVGASSGSSNNGYEDLTTSYLEKGIWEFGWYESEDYTQVKRFRKIGVGDRIAIKRKLNDGTKIQIKALGIIKKLEESDKDKSPRVSVEWIIKDLERDVASRGCFASIHGPYTLENDKDRNWIREVFCI